LLFNDRILHRDPRVRVLHDVLERERVRGQQHVDEDFSANIDGVYAHAGDEG